MAAAVVDLDINEGDTFIMSIEFWENVDNTIPSDITTSTFTGTFKIGTKDIPITCAVSTYANNVLELLVAYSLMRDLASKGRYEVDQLTVDNENFRLIQGAVRVNQEVSV